jgi:large subunit ribosomal protein L3
MKKVIIGKKVGMTQIFDADGKVIPVTVIEAGPCVVVQKKTADKEGFDAVQLGFEDIVEKKLSKGEAGHFKKADVAPKKVLREVRLENAASMNVGDIIKADVFAEGDCVDVTGISKGHGYAGVVKRWGQAVQCHTHGVGPVHRSPGSMGANTSPSRVMPGKRLAGHMGVDQVTVQNLDVVKIDADKNLLAVRGAVPGPKGGIVLVKNTTKVK